MAVPENNAKAHKNWSEYRVQEFKVIYVACGDVERVDSNQYTTLKDTMQLYQVENIKDQSRSEQLKVTVLADYQRRADVSAAHVAAGRNKGKVVVPNKPKISHMLSVRSTSCYCKKCRVGLHSQCEPLRAGYDNFFALRTSGSVRENVTVPSPPRVPMAATPLAILLEQNIDPTTRACLRT